MEITIMRCAFASLLVTVRASYSRYSNAVHDYRKQLNPSSRGVCCARVFFLCFLAYVTLCFVCLQFFPHEELPWRLPECNGSLWMAVRERPRHRRACSNWRNQRNFGSRGRGACWPRWHQQCIFVSTSAWTCRSLQPANSWKFSSGWRDYICTTANPDASLWNESCWLSTQWHFDRRASCSE